MVVPTSYHLSRGDPDHLEPLHHRFLGKLYSSGCGGDEDWRIHEAVSGNQSVNEYLHAFNNLARYALEFVNTDAKKIASFQRGLSPKMLKTWVQGPELLSMPTSVIV